MRKKHKSQMSLMMCSIGHPHAAELEGISRILDSNPIIYEWVWQDLSPKAPHPGTGAEGMSAEQVRRGEDRNHRRVPACAAWAQGAGPHQPASGTLIAVREIQYAGIA